MVANSRRLEEEKERVEREKWMDIEPVSVETSSYF